MPLTLVDQDGQSFALDSYRGHPVLVSMFYASCPYACPTLISQIQRVDRALSARARGDLRVLLVSFDPERDTPEKLKQLCLERHVDETRWRLARASADDVRQLAAVLGVKYKRLDDGGYNHSSVITVLDQQGFVRARSDGLAQQVDPQIGDALSLLARNGA
ncbi:MAG TPA: SCO family protein [Polyangiaceae bacterium]